MATKKSPERSSIRVGIYAGSFDPPTVGHLWMIDHAQKVIGT
jgi:phosphopantetheine adenylyltransferase